jgi:hypothetical protein
VELEAFHCRVGENADLILWLKLSINKMERRLPGLFDSDGIVESKIEEQEKFPGHQLPGWRGLNLRDFRSGYLF